MRIAIEGPELTDRTAEQTNSIVISDLMYSSAKILSLPCLPVWYHILYNIMYVFSVGVIARVGGGRGGDSAKEGKSQCCIKPWGAYDGEMVLRKFSIYVKLLPVLF